MHFFNAHPILYWSRHKHWQFMYHLKSLFAILISLQYLIRKLAARAYLKNIATHNVLKWHTFCTTNPENFVYSTDAQQWIGGCCTRCTKPKTMNKLLNPLSKHLVLRNYCCWCQKSTFQKRWQLVNLLGQIPFIVGWTTKQLWYMESCRLKISRNIWFGGTAEKTYICK